MEGCKTVATSLDNSKAPHKEDVTPKLTIQSLNSYWGSTLLDSDKPRYYVYYRSTIKVYAESKKSSLWSS